jgi:two-component system NtrC family sensor kinase
MKKTYPKTEEKINSEGAELRQPVAQLEASVTGDKQAVPTVEEQPMTPDEVANLVRELEVHQFELETQNEELRQMQQRLQETRDRYINLYDNAPSGYFTLGRFNNTITEVNLTGCSLLGIERDHLLGTEFTQYISPEFDDIFYSCQWKPAKSLIKENHEIKMHRYDGSAFWAELRITSLMNSPQLNIAILDITERKKAEEALADEATRRRILVDQSRDGIVVLDQNGKVYEANKEFAEMLGYTPEETAKLNVWDWEAVMPHERVLEMIRTVDEAGDHFETQHRRKDGSVYDVEISTNGAVIAGQKLIFCVCRNITERKQAEEALRESQEQLKRMFDSVTDGIVLTALDGTIIKANQRAVQMHGFTSPAEMIGKSASEIVPPRNHEKMSQDMRQTIKRGIIRVRECALLKSDGTEFPAELSTSILKDASGRVMGHITIVRDITKRKEAEERQKEMQRELLLSSRLASIGELAAGVAHQLNNPLTGVLGFSERLLRKSTDTENKQYLERIYTEAARATKVVQNLLTFARRCQPHKQCSDINEILENALELRAYELKTSNIEVVTDLATNLPRTMLDFPQIQEVFLNIILNAEQAMTEAKGDGKLTIKTKEIKGYIRITFSDDGPGISPEDLDKIFDPFYTTKGAKGGTGLGLSVCHGIITEHGGRIYARNNPGTGATFLVELPLANDQCTGSNR